MNKKLEPCPHCGSTNLEDCHSYIRCNNCYLSGPKIKSRNSLGLDVLDYGFAAKVWNNLPRKVAVNA